jgi:hypothetical protein
MANPSSEPKLESIDPRTCEHPNLFGCSGHCVWCDAELTYGPRLIWTNPVMEKRT